MANKKDFTKNVPVDLMTATVAADTKGVQSASDTNNTTDTKEELFRFSARFTADQWRFLQEKKWNTRKSITAILQDYVDEDIKKHPEIVAKIDELNG